MTQLACCDAGVILRSPACRLRLVDTIAVVKMHFTSIVRTVLVPIQHDCHEIVKLICHDAQIQDTWHLLAIAL